MNFYQASLITRTSQAQEQNNNDMLEGYESFRGATLV